MRYLLLLCLIVFFGYALGLVVLNNTETAVNLLFVQSPAMNLGLLLIVSIVLGLFIGIIVSVLIFRVLQKHLEIKRLKKDNELLKSKVDTLTIESDKLGKEKEMLKSMVGRDESRFLDESINND